MRIMMAQFIHNRTENSDYRQQTIRLNEIVKKWSIISPGEHLNSSVVIGMVIQNLILAW